MPGSVTCSACNMQINDIYIEAFNMFWHPFHLACKICGKDFSDGSKVEEGPDGFAYCGQDYNEVFAPKCQGCGEMINGEVINAGQVQFHPEHFGKMYSHPKFANLARLPSKMGSFSPVLMEMPTARRNLVVTPRHYFQVMNLLCDKCKKPIISGKCISMGAKKFHPQHFDCTFCKKNLAGSGYKRKDENPYCSSCHLQLFE